MDNINDIISNLTDDDINMLKSVASSILGESGQNSDKTNIAPQDAKPQNNGTVNSRRENQINTSALPSALAGLDGIDFDMIMKAKSIFDKMNSTSNKNADLIMALKPHLRPETQNKADTAVRILKLFEVLPLIREMF